MKQLTQERTTQGIATIITLLAVLIIGSVVAVSPTQTTAQDSIRLYDGDLIKSPSNPDVYIVKYINNKWFKRLILNPEIFNSYGHLSWDNIKTVNQDTIDNHTTSNLVIEVDKDGTPVNGRVYYLTSAPNTDTGIKHHLNITAQEFSNLGLDWDSIYKINSTEAGPTFYKTGTAVTVANFNAVIRGSTTTSPVTTTPPGTTTPPPAPDQDASFRATLSSNTTNIEINENQQKEVAEFTLRSTNNDSTIDDVTLRLTPRGGDTNNKNLADSFTDIELLLNGSSVKKVATDSSAVRKNGEDYLVNFNFIPDVVIGAGATEQLTVRMHTQTSLTDAHFQGWSLGMEAIDLKGTYAEEYKTSAARIFTVTEKKVPFITIDHQYNQHLIGNNNSATMSVNSAQNANLLVASISNKKTVREETIILDELQVKIQPPDARYIGDNINSVSLYAGSQRIGTTQLVNSGNPTSTFTFSNLNRQIRPGTTHLITVRANIQPQSTARNTDITTTISSTSIKARYSSNNQPVADGFITGTARNTIHLSIARPGSIATTFLAEPVNPHITTTAYTTIGVLQMTAEHSSTTINQIQVALESQGTNRAPYQVFRQMNLLVDGRTYTRNVAASSTWIKNGSIYTTSFDNLSIPVSQGKNKNVTVQIQTINNPTSSPTQEWQLSIPNQGVQGTNSGTNQHSTNTPTKNFFVGDTVYSTLGQNNPAAQTLSAKQSNNKVELLEFKVANHSTTDHTIDSFTVQLTGNQLGTGKTLNNIIEKIYLLENDRVIRTITNTSTLSPTTSTDILFDNISRTLNRGAEKTFKIAVDVPQQNTHYSYSSGAQIHASLTRVSFANSAVSLSNTLNGNWMTFTKEGVVSITKHATPDNTTITPQTTHDIAQFTLSVDGEAVEVKAIDVFLSRVSGQNNNPWDIIDRIDLYDQTRRIGYLSLNSRSLTDNKVSFIATVPLSSSLSLRQINPRTITVKVITRRLSNNLWHGVWDVRLRALNATSDKATFTLATSGLSNLLVWREDSDTKANLRWFVPIPHTSINAYEIEYCDVTTSTSCTRWQDVGTTTTPRLSAALTSRSTTAKITDLTATKVYRFRIRYTQTNPTRYSTWVTSSDIDMDSTSTTSHVSNPIVSTSNPPTINSITLEWKKEPGTTYLTRYCKGSNCSNWIEKTLLTRTKSSDASILQATFLELEAGTTYTFQIQAVQNNKGSGWPDSPTVEGTTLLNPPRSLKATTTDSQITLTWVKPQGIVNTSDITYAIQACTPNVIGTTTSSHCSDTDWKETLDPVANAITSTTYTLQQINTNDLTPNTSYDIRIQAKRGTVTSAWVIIGNVITKRTSAAPTIQLSSVEPPTTNTLTVEWDSVTGARYEAQYCSPSGTDCTNREWTTANNAIAHTISQRPGVAKLTLRSLTPGTRYNVRVRTVLDGSRSDWSAVLKTRTKLQTPVIRSSSVRSSSGADGSITFQWTRVIGSATYEVEYCEYDAGRSCPTANNQWRNSSSPKTPSASIIESRPYTAGNRYRVRVRAQAPTTDLVSTTPEYSEWSNPITVTISSS